MANFLKETFKGLYSLIVGLRVTGENFASSQVTVHYPRNAVTNMSTFRGHIELVPKDDELQTPRCIACGTCARACPSTCITVVMDKSPEQREPEVKVAVDRGVPAARKAPPTGKKKFFNRPKTFELDYTKCSLCGLCVGSCPVDAIRFSQHVYIASLSQEDYHIDLLDRMRTTVSPSSAQVPKVNGVQSEERV